MIYKLINKEILPSTSLKLIYERIFDYDDFWTGNNKKDVSRYELDEWRSKLKVYKPNQEINFGKYKGKPLKK